MTELDEVAAAMADRYHTALAEAQTVSSVERARALVDELMPDDSGVHRGIVADTVHSNRVAVEKLLREADADARDLAAYWEQRGVIVTIARYTLQPPEMRSHIAYVETRLKR